MIFCATSMNKLCFLVPLLLASACTPAATVSSSRSAELPGLAAISESDLRRDLFAMAGDSMRGRMGATSDELRASAWLAERAREAGMEPAGDDGTFFQFFPVRRVRVAGNSEVSVGGTPLRLWEDAFVVTPVDARLDAPLVWANGAADVRGKAVIANLQAPPNVPPRWVSLWAYRYTLAAIREQAAALSERGAAAVVLVADSISARQFPFVGHVFEDGRFVLDSLGAEQRPGVGVPVFWVEPNVRERLTAGQRLVADLRSESFVYPSVNVVARVPGSDPALRGEHVLFSGHQDHDGIRSPINGDSIWNGADDNATVSVAMLAIGRAFARQPGRRSALFVWHGSEERGLLGSRWYAQQPTVPRGSIVAVLNGDMIGRNHPDSAALLGVIPPHRNSTPLVEMALDANRRVAGFALDSTWDAPTHPENWYFRSDHLPYARAGIPAIFFTTLLHPDYHTPEDEPERIDITKLARMTRWMYATGWAAANAPERPRLDPGFKLER